MRGRASGIGEDLAGIKMLRFGDVGGEWVWCYEVNFFFFADEIYALLFVEELM